MSTTRVAFVTGGAQGLGEAIALRLAQDGLDVAILDISGKETQLQAVADKITAKGRKALWLVGDVADETSVKDSIAKVVEVLGSLDVMVANAGIAPGFGKAVVDSNLDEWQGTFSVNILGVMLSYKHAAIQMIKQGRGGRILGACSILGKKGKSTSQYSAIHAGAYSVSKFAVRGLTHIMAEELKEHNITVNAYAPGLIITAISTHPDDEANGGPGSSLLKAIQWAPDTRIGEPEVVSSLVSYLASPEAYFMTGQIVSVDGGLNLD
ncbi:NAD-P-binding protein [Trametopsis cervina]|nr:NAD-P-binding protein [Trametopsis cervina]